MLFLTIFTYEPDKRDELVKKRAEMGRMMPDGLKLHGEWSAIGGGKVFRVIEADDPKLALGAVHAWSDLGKIEIIPVMETEEVISLIPK